MAPRLKISHPRLEGYNKEYEDNLRPDLMKDEPERIRRVRAGFIIAVLLTPPSIWLAWYFGFAVKNPDSDAVHLAYIIPLLGYFSVVGTLMARTKFKLVQSISEFLNWSHSEGEDQSKLIERLHFFGLLPEYKIKRVDDVLRGHHENWQFEMCEIVLQKYEGWGRNRRLVTVFQGMVLSFKLGYVSPAVTVLTRERGIGHPKAPQIMHHEGTYKDKLGEVIVRSSDTTALKTVMCTRFQSVIEDLTQSLPMENISCLVDKHYLHIPFKAKDRFEMDYMLDNMGSTHRVQKMLDEFSEILVLLDIVLKRRACSESGVLDYPQFRATKNGMSEGYIQ